MWLVNFVKKVLFPLVLVLFFSWVCIMFVWNEHDFKDVNFHDINQTWFNLKANGQFDAPKGILGKAIATYVSDTYNNPKITTNLTFVDLFHSATWRGMAIVYVMPVGVSLLFGIAVFTVLSILWAIVRHLIKSKRKAKQNAA